MTRSPLAGLTSLAVAGLLMYLLPAPAYGQTLEEARTVTGRVVNQTSEGGPVSGLPVVLHEQSMSRHHHFEANTDPAGHFTFEDVSYDAESGYAVTVTYGGALYGRDIDLSDVSPPPLELAVYESTSDESVISVADATVMYSRVDEASQNVWALEIVRLLNDSEFTYVPGPEPMKLLRFGLPPRAEELRVDTALMEPDVIQVDRGFALTASVPPGNHVVGYTYRFPYADGRVTLSKSLLYGAGSLRVLAPRGVAELSSADMGEAEVVDIGGLAYNLLTATDLPRGAVVSVSLDALPRSSLGQRLGRRLAQVRFEYAAPVGLAALMVSALAVALWKRKDFRGASSFTGTKGPVAGERASVVREIAELDRRFRDGALGEDRYRRRRHELIERLTDPSSQQVLGQK